MERNSMIHNSNSNLLTASTGASCMLRLTHQHALENFQMKGFESPSTLVPKLGKHITTKTRAQIFVITVKKGAHKIRCPTMCTTKTKLQILHEQVGEGTSKLSLNESRYKM